MYGVKGNDETMSLWKNAQLTSKTKPLPLQFRASTQMGRKMYFHGGIDFTETELDWTSDEVWEFDIDERRWRRLETGGKSPGARSGHTMFA